MDSDSSQFLSFSEGKTSTGSSPQCSLVHVDGTSSGSGGDPDEQPKQYPEPLKPWHFTDADVFILPYSPYSSGPNSPEPRRPKKIDIPKLALKPAEEVRALKERDERREKIKQNLGEKFVRESEKEEIAGKALALLRQETLNSSRSGHTSPDTSSPTKRKERVLSNETPLPRSVSNPLNVIPKTLQSPSTPPTSPATEPVTKKEVPQIPTTPPSTPLPNPTPPASPRKTSLETSSVEKNGTNTSKEDNTTSMPPLTWKNHRSILVTITGFTITGLLLLYYLDRLPANLSANIDNLLARFRMQG